mgnify:CR=1 FL=1
MKDAEIIEALCAKLAAPGGRHLYGVLGTYPALGAFAHKLRQVRAPDGNRFPRPLSVARGILQAIPEDELLRLAADEAKRPEPVAAHVARAFERFLRSQLKGRNLLILGEFELLFAYHVELTVLRSMAADGDRVLLLLPGRRESGRVIMFPGLTEGAYTLPTNLIADDHLWELKG